MVIEVGFDIKIMLILQNHNVSYINKVTNANTIGIIIYEKGCTPRLIKDMQFTINRKHFILAQRALNSALCEKEISG